MAELVLLQIRVFVVPTLVLRLLIRSLWPPNQ